MANSNSLTEVIPQILAQGLLALREMAIMPRLVNRKFEEEAGQKGSTIDIPIPSAITAASVTHNNTVPDRTGFTPTSVSIALDQWYEAAFFMSDKDFLEAQAGTIPGQASEAVKALANNVDDAILAQYVNVYGYAGVAATTPFATDTSEFLASRKLLFNQLSPAAPRRVVLDTDAEANALALRAFQDNAWRGDNQGIMEAQIGRKLGSDWFVDQNIPTHTAGTGASGTTDASGYALGIKSITLASAGSGTLVVGDIFTIAGDSQTYTATGTVANFGAGGTLAFEPGLQVAITTSTTAVTLKATHVVNLNFHRDAFAFVNRPFASSDPLGLGQFSSDVDPVSGLSLRLEASRLYKRTDFSYDLLYGVQTVRPEFATRIAG